MGHESGTSWSRRCIAAVIFAILALPLSAQTISDPAWGFSFPLPAGWKFQKDAGGAVLGHDTIAGLIMVFPHAASSLQEMRAEMEQGFAEEGVQLAIVGGLQPVGSNGLAGDCEGYFQGEQVKGRTLGAVSPAGGGAYVMAITTPAMYGREIAAAADQIVRGMQFPTGGASDLIRALAGTWTTMTTHSQTSVTLGANGEFAMHSESSYSGSFRGPSGGDAGGWGTARNDESGGRWTAAGTRERGTITLVYQNGERSTIPFQVHVERGQTYWNEYFFDDVLYARSR